MFWSIKKAYLKWKCLDSDNLCSYARTTMERQKEKQAESLAKYLKEGKLALVSEVIYCKGLPSSC